MLLHAFTGCDTVSSIYGFNKGKLFKNLVESSNYTNDLFEIFIRDNSSVQEISNAGIRIFQIIYKTNGITLGCFPFDVSLPPMKRMGAIC